MDKKRTKADLISTLIGCEIYFTDYHQIPDDLIMIRHLIEQHVTNDQVRKEQE